jgi:hypothetical protein
MAVPFSLKQNYFDLFELPLRIDVLKTSFAMRVGSLILQNGA